MKTVTKMAMIAAIAGMSFATTADTIDLDYTGTIGGSSAGTARIGSSTYLAGHMTHTITSGDRAGQTFNTFCIELGEYASNGTATYEIINLADAPAYYGQTKANAYAMGWIDSKFQATNTEDANYLAKMGALQAAVWETLGNSFDVNNSSTSSSVHQQYSLLTNNESSFRMAGLRGAVATGQQDQLFVVPLPSGALAGLGMLVGIAGIRSARRR